MQEHFTNSKNTPQVISIAKPKPYKPSFNHPSTTPSFSPPANPSSTQAPEQSNFTLQDFLFIPKLLTLGRDVYSMASQGLGHGDMTRQVRDRFNAIHHHPNIALNVNVHLKEPSSLKQQNCEPASFKTYQFLINVGNAQVKEKFQPHLDVNVESQMTSKENTDGRIDPPTPPKSEDAENAKNCNFANQHTACDAVYTFKTARIRKRKSCTCIKRKSLEELIRQERSFNKQIERVKYFWKGENVNHPFMFKKKQMDFYTETEEAMVSEFLDFSKTTIHAEDMQLSISNK